MNCYHYYTEKSRTAAPRGAAAGRSQLIVPAAIVGEVHLPAAVVSGTP